MKVIVLKLTAIVLCLFLVYESHSQDFIWSTDTISKTDPNYPMERYHQVLHYNDPLMFLVFPIVEPVVNRTVPLKDGEGKDGYWLEGSFGYRFAIYKGKHYSPPFLQRMRITLDASLHSMLARDQSNPILPFNIKVGAGLDFLITPLSNLKKDNSVLAWTCFQLHHYSNGEADTFFLDAPYKRNNYQDGSFSSNYLRGTLNVGVNRKNLFITTIGYEHLVDPGGPLGNSTELKNYYGDGKLLLQFNWIKKPQITTRTYINRGVPNGGTVKKEKRRQIGVRTELEYITGDLSGFPHDNKYRIGGHTYITYMPSVTNEVGFMIHAYLGRHYLNIRFDDVVFAGGIGLYLKLDGR